MWCERLEEEAFTKAAVVARSKRFVWLLVNRDRTPEVPKRFNVSAYPTLLTLGDGLEKIHRFQGFRKAAEVLAELGEKIDAGYPTVKIFTTDITPSRRGRMIRFGDVWEIFKVVSARGGLAVIHAEDNDIVMHMYDKLIAADRVRFEHLAEVHNALSEELSFRRVIRLAEKMRAPIVNTLLGKGAADETHPLHLGMLGMHGTAYANKAVDGCDCIMAIGARWDDRITGKLDEFCVDAAKIHIDVLRDNDAALEFWKAMGFEVRDDIHRLSRVVRGGGNA